MQETFTVTLEQIMKNTDAYLFILTVSLLLAAPIVHAIQTLLALRARVIFPLLRIQTGPHCATMITAARSMDVIVCPHCASSFDRHVDVSYATCIQPTEAL